MAFRPVSTFIWSYFPAILIALGALLATGGGFWQSFRQSNYNREIKERNETIMRLQNNIISRVTGGDSFIYLRTTDPIKNSTNMMLSMAFPTLSGRYSLHDVQIQIFGSFGGIIYLHYDLVSPNSPILEPRYIELLFPKIISGVVDLTVFITSSAGTLFQTIRFARVHDRWCQATRVFRNRDIIYASADPICFPKGVDWSKP